MRAKRLCVVIASALLSGCGVGDAPRHAVVRDSAGVRIVESDLTSAQLPVHEIAREALVEIGVAEGEAPYQLDNVRMARWLPDGSIAVLNGGSAEVRVFDQAGGYVRTHGRRGGGPGEYASPYELWPLADSILVLDYGRIVVTSLADGSSRTLGPEFLPDARPYSAGALFGAGAVVIPIPDGRPTAAGDWIDVGVDYVRVPIDGSPTDTIAHVPGGRDGIVPFRTSTGADAVLFTHELFGARAHAAMRGTRFLAGIASHRRIVEYDTSGVPIRDIRWTSPGEPVTADRVETFIQERIAAAPSLQGVRQSVEVLPHADTFPHFDALLADDQGRLWMRSFDLPGEESPPHWTVFDTAGIAEAIVELPRGLEVYEVHGDRVLGMREDSLGVQQVVVLPIRPAG